MTSRHITLEKHAGKNLTFKLHRYSNHSSNNVVYVTIWLWALNVEFEMGWWPSA